MNEASADGRRSWSAEEDAALRAVYAKDGLRAAMAAFPYRSRRSITERTRRLHLKRRPQWTPSEDRTLTGLWDDGTRMDLILRDLPGRSRSACYLRARHLGLEPACPRGFEFLSHAAKRTGFGHTGYMRKVLRAAGVRVKLALASTAKRKYRQHIVEPEEVDRAVAEWNLRESVSRAAARAGLTPNSLRRWLIALGEAPPANRRHWWRVTDEQVAKVLAHRATTATVPEMAARYGIDARELRQLLRALGFKSPARYWRVTTEQVMAAMRRGSHQRAARALDRKAA